MSSQPLSFPADPGQKLIGAMLSADWTRGAARRVPPAVFDGVDWPVLPHLAWQHKIRPIAATALREAGWPGVPAAVRTELEAAERESVTRGMRQVALLRSIALAAEREGLRLMMLKGIALSQHLYGDPFIREAFDLDLLVDPADVARLDAILLALGCVDDDVVSVLGPRQTAALQRFHHDRKFRHAASGMIVERHHALDRNPHLITTDFAALWTARGSVRIGDFAVAIPGPVDLPHYLGTHAARHAWERWKWIADLAILYQRLDADGWDALHAAARRDGNETLFRSWILLVATATRADLPPAIVAAAQGDARARRLAQGALDYSAPPRPRGGLTQRAHLRSSAYRLGLRRDWAFLRFELARLIHRDGDWHRFALPDRLIALRYVGWPILYAGRRLGLGRVGPRPPDRDGKA